MEFIKAQARQIAEQLRGMSLSQRIAIGLLVVVVVGGMWGMISWGGQPQWVPLLDQSFTAQESSRVRAELRAAGIDSRIEGDRVMIRGGDAERQQAQALLSERGAMPTDTSLAYAALVKENSVFIGEQRSRWMESRGLETELSAVLRRFQGIADARVLITVPQKRGFTRQEVASSASVALTMIPGEEMDKERILAIANFVAGAVPGLALENIKLTDGKRFYRAPDGGEQIPTEILELQQRIEDHYMQKIYDQLRNIGGVVVNVHAKLRTAAEKSQEEVYGPPVVQRETSTAEENAGAGRAAEPAVRPNTRAGIAEAGPGSTSTREETDTTFSDKRDVRTTLVDELRGSVERVSASVSIPRSYLERIVNDQQAGADKPAATLDSIEKTATAEMPRIRALVKPLIDATKDDQVVVDWYYDLPAQAAEPQAASAVDGFMALARDEGPKAGLGLLALVSVLVMFRIARKAQSALVGSTGPVVAVGAAGVETVSEVARSPLKTLGGGGATVGEAQELEGVMVAHEVNEEMVRTKQIVGQIGQMVMEDAATAAGIVQQWIHQEE